MNLFGKKTDLENTIDKFKQVFNTEKDMTEASSEILGEWCKLEAEYARELTGIKSRLDRIPRKFG